MKKRREGRRRRRKKRNGPPHHTYRLATLRSTIYHTYIIASETHAGSPVILSVWLVAR